jgi:heme oxygenase (biliverdin-IX-beta and delta-forming)
MQRLKEETRGAHASAESAVRLLDDALTLDDYRGYLSRMYGLISAFEAELAGFGEWRELGIDFEARRKLPLLERDLAVLGVDSAALPVYRGLDLEGDFARVLGAAYVIEGSTLGGQILARHVEEKLGLGAESGAAFLRSYGAELGRRWREFGAAVERYAEADPASLAPRILAGANEAFEAFLVWLSPREAERAVSAA